MINYKKIVAFISAVALIVPISGMVDSSQLGDIGVFAEDTSTDTTDETPTQEVELVNGKVPTSVENFQYKIENNSVTITKYIGSDLEVVIPKEIDGYPVRTINGYGSIYINGGAFEDTYITSVTIPNTVVEIKGDTNIALNWSAFKNCTSLKEVIFEENSNLATIGNGAFYGCVSLSSIDIPDSVTAIASEAFQGSGLESVSISENIQSMGSSAFRNCSHLTKIDFGNITTIPSKAFSGCTALTEIEIPSTVKTIADSAFSGCSTLINVTFNEGLLSIGDGAFKGCNLKEVIIPNGVQSIGYGAFQDNSITSLTLPTDITIGSYAFENCTIKNLTIQDGTDIGSYAFSGCRNLTQITTIGNVSIGIQCFMNCSSMVKAVLSRETQIASGGIGAIGDISPTYSSILTIYGYLNTPAHQYATLTGIKFVDIESGETVTTQETPKGDLDGDGKVNIMDLLKLKKYILGIIDSLD